MNIGIDIGGTHIKGVLIDHHKVVKKITRNTMDGVDRWQDSVAEVFAELVGLADAKVTAVGLSAPGIADQYNRKIICMPGRLKGLEEFDWSTFLSHPVQVLNDAHAALVAESSWGAARDIPNVVMLTLGTGIGGGLLINGQLYQGFLQRAGHLGHICVEAANEHQDITGISGSLEDAVGEATLSKRSLGRFSNTSELIAAHISGDTWATYVWLTTVRKLALGIVSFCNAISPDLVVLAGGITQAQEQLLEPLFTFLELYEWRVDGHSTPVKLAHFKEFAGATGAALFARTNN